LTEAAKPAYVAPQTRPSAPASWRESGPPRASDTSPAPRAPTPRPTRKPRAKPIAMSRTSGVGASPERPVEGRRIRRDRREDCGAVRFHIVQARHAVNLPSNQGGGKYGGTSRSGAGTTTPFLSTIGRCRDRCRGPVCPIVLPKGSPPGPDRSGASRSGRPPDGNRSSRVGRESRNLLVPLDWIRDPGRLVNLEKMEGGVAARDSRH
jgi:hypothetical protein